MEIIIPDEYSLNSFQQMPVDGNSMTSYQYVIPEKDQFQAAPQMKSSKKGVHLR